MIIEHPSLLITDDDRDLRETLGEVFRPRGFHTLLASDGAEAVEIVENQSVHLVLFDLHMPRLSGLEAIRLIKQTDESLPCILMSAALDETVKEEAEQAHVFSVHAKPVNFAELTKVVSEAMWQTYRWTA